MSGLRKPHVIALCSPNQSRLEHVRKLSALRDSYEITCCRVGPGMGWERRFVDNDLEIPEGNGTAPAAAARRLIDGLRPPDGIVNFSEAYVPLHAELCEHYGLTGPTPAAVRVGRNKLYMRRFLRDLGIPVPDFEVLTSRTLGECARLSYPVVVKPAIGCSSTLVQRVDSHEELSSRFGQLQEAALRAYAKELLLDSTLREFGEFPFVAEEMLGGSVQFPTRLPYPVGEISVESIAYGGETRVLAIHDAPVPSNGPFYEKVVNSTPTRIPAPLREQAIDYVSRVHAALGPGAYVLHSEMRTFADRLMFLEFGVRVGGSSLYRSVLHSTGNDFVEILIRLSLDRRPALSDAPARPTIIHYLVPQTSGRIKCVKGLTRIRSSPYYLDYELYDDAGDVVRRPPLRSRASGYFALGGGEFDALEREALRLIGEIEIEVAPCA
jgi:biotin carboxylase